MKRKQLFILIGVALLSGLVAVVLYSAIIDDAQNPGYTDINRPVSQVALVSALDTSTDFTYASERTIDGVVHVTTQATVEYRNPIYEWFYGDRYPGQSQNVEAYGSGVIVTADGYIVTNNHVIDNSSSIKVVLNDKREFDAKIIGTDPSTDLALMKIDAENLPFVPFGNSDELKIGEWVLAVGNPFNINSTVTAGIVSAKARGVDIIDDDYKIESFIQTDAAVNRGNSGGALVNLKGEMVGITTAIASPSGGSVGISFAVPTSIVEKVVKDLMEYGTVQRGIMGVQIQELTASLAKEKDINNLEGVYVADITAGGGAEESGIKAGDIILEINGTKVNSPSSLQEQVVRYRPGDKISVLIKRNNKTQQLAVVLRNLQGNTAIVKGDTGASSVNDRLGATFSNLSDQEKQKLRLSGGVKVTGLKNGILRQQGVREGFIITDVNKEPVNTVDELNRALRSLKGGVLVEGVYPDGTAAYYAFGL